MDGQEDKAYNDKKEIDSDHFIIELVSLKIDGENCYNNINDTVVFAIM